MFYAKLKKAKLATNTDLTNVQKRATKSKKIEHL